MWNSIRPTLAMLALCLAGGSLRAQGTSSLRFNGDSRVRYEYTGEGNGSPALWREVVRFRLGLT